MTGARAVEVRVLALALLRPHLQAGQRASNHRPHCQPKHTPCPRPHVPQSQSKAMEVCTMEVRARPHLTIKSHKVKGKKKSSTASRLPFKSAARQPKLPLR